MSYDSIQRRVSNIIHYLMQTVPVTVFAIIPLLYRTVYIKMTRAVKVSCTVLQPWSFYCKLRTKSIEHILYQNTFGMLTYTYVLCSFAIRGTNCFAVFVPLSLSLSPLYHNLPWSVETYPGTLSLSSQFLSSYVCWFTYSIRTGTPSSTVLYVAKIHCSNSAKNPTSAHLLFFFLGKYFKLCQQPHEPLSQKW